jgi:formamidopyrimidine-DNA glycosylase
MPELGEVENYRRRWEPARGARVLQVRLHPRARVFRGTSVARLRRLAGETLIESEARGKLMLFRFTGGLWLGIHLGMTGRLRVDGAGGRNGPQAGREPVRRVPAPNRRHDHLRLVTEAGVLAFSDPRLFGRVRVDVGESPPSWWREMPPAVTSGGFTTASLGEFLRRRGRSPLKAVLLDQDRFPGIGNWMADEVLWRAGLHPRLPAGSLDVPSLRRLHRALRFVARSALRILGEGHGALPAGWFFHVRWADGGFCPRTGVPLVRETVGGRTTCWSPGRQPEPGRKAPRRNPR